MALISKTNTFSAGAVIVASEHNDNFDTIYNDYNGNITNANVAAGAAIADTKLAQITTANKVDATALTETSEAAGVVLGHDGSDWSSISASTQRYKFLMSQGSTSAASFQSVNLASAASVTGALPVANGGSGTTGDSIIKAWVNFNGKDLTIQDSYNVSAVVTNGTGAYKVKWDTNFANTSHAVVATCNGAAAGRMCTISNIAADSVSLITMDHAGSAESVSIVNVIALGDQ